MCFFFQAEDGIRDAQESRGLGDVYKRQVVATNILIYQQLSFHHLKVVVAPTTCSQSAQRRHDLPGPSPAWRTCSVPAPLTTSSQCWGSHWVTKVERRRMRRRMQLLVALTMGNKTRMQDQMAAGFSSQKVVRRNQHSLGTTSCLLYTSDAADEEDSVDLGGRRIIKKKKNKSDSK
eukprot:TRINITY_DN10301_c0_g1_i2.p1 TRINITY_DN10301_c0_g1~~TRINITY_DN10301_c0_g1_i2.p1  ORF type:complete len:176 (+),score=40.68 TRINITY_DN10301_c0_g1_i2:114-641(+)